MLITDDEAKHLKIWVIKKLEDISDADSDVLADYVLALIRADTPEPELRANAIENLEDFLKEHTSVFVDDTFVAIRTKSYIPGYIPPPQVSALTSSTLTAPTGPAAYSALGARNVYEVGTPQPRKRSYNDRQEEKAGYDPHYGRGDRQMKQMRRGNLSNGRGGSGHGRHERDFQLPNNPPGIAPSLSAGFPGLPMPANGMPFDPNDPIGAILAMQAMGFPPLPAMPDLSQAGSPAAFPSGTGQLPFLEASVGKSNTIARCRDYDTKGFCARGNACSFDHGNNRIIVPGQHEEYDPNNSLMMDIQTTSKSTNGHVSSNISRGSFSGRSRAQGRGDRGASMSQRRNRADFSQAGPNHDRSITTVVVEQIPEENFNEKSVRDFFSDFGNIEEVTMQAYKRLALVKYEDYYSAKRAYESPKVIFDNRFVKVYWYNPNTMLTAPTAGTGTNASSPTSPTKADDSTFDKEKFERDSLAAQKKLEERKALQRETEARRLEIQKQKDELDRKRDEEKRKLEEKLKAKGLSLEDIGVEPSTSKPTQNGASGSKASSQTEALRAQLAALEAEARGMGIDPDNPEPFPARGRGRGRGRGSYRGWEGFAGRGASYDPSRGAYRGRGSFRGARGGGAYNLDNRTKKVKVEGVTFDAERDEGLKHFLIGIGEFESIETSASKGSQVITFKDRFTAEKLMYGPKDIPGVGKVEISWVNTPLPPVNLPAAKLDGDLEMGGVDAEQENGDGGRDGHHGAQEVDYDVAEEDDRWGMVS